MSDVLLAMSQLMLDCHRECLALQETISDTNVSVDADPRHIAVYQNLDHMTQVHEDLARLLPELAQAIRGEVGPVDALADALRLISLRHRLFGYDHTVAGTANHSGEVSLF